MSANDQLIEMIADAVALKILARLDERRTDKPAVRKLLYSINEAAEALSRSPIAIRKLIDRKQLPCRRNDRRVQIHVKDIEEFAQRDVG